MNIKQITYKSPLFWKMVSLRFELLREPLSLKFSEEDLLQEVNELHFAAIMDKEEDLIGTLLLRPINENSIKMRQVCVNANFQGKGVGTKLVKCAEKYAKKYEYKEIYCHSRESAIAFYEKLEYQKVGNIFNEVGIPHIKMFKRINT